MGGRQETTRNDSDHIVRENDLQPTDPKACYHIGTRAAIREDVHVWMNENRTDPAFRVCMVNVIIRRANDLIGL